MDRQELDPSCLVDIDDSEEDRLCNAMDEIEFQIKWGGFVSFLNEFGISPSDLRLAIFLVQIEKSTSPY